MTFDPQTIGTHAGTGMLGSFLAYFGIKQRIDRIEKGQDEIRQWIESSGNKVVYKDVHETCSQSWHAMFADVYKRQILALRFFQVVYFFYDLYKIKKGVNLCYDVQLLKVRPSTRHKLK